MKQLFLNKGKVFLAEVPNPQLEDNNIIVKVYYSFISSGTEIATISESEKSLLKKFTQNTSKNINKISGAIKTDGILGTLALIKSKLKQVATLGYSCSGKVIAVGKGVTKFKVGDYVACAGAGFANHAEIVSVPMNLATKVTNKDLLKSSCITTIGAIAMQGFRRAELELGEKVCIYGLGLIGQITAQLCKLAGCQVFGIDIQEDRIELAQKLGIDFVFNANGTNVVDQINFFTNHYGVDATIITAASSQGQIIDNSMNITRRKGKVVLVGDVNLNFNRDPFYSKEIDFLISCSYGPGRYDSSYEIKGQDYPYSYVRWTENRNMELFVDLLEKEKLNLEPFISNEFDLFNVENAYSFLRKNKGLGVVISFDQNISKNLLKDLTEELEIGSYRDLDSGKCKQENVFRALPYKPPLGKLNTGFVGVGGFAKVKLLPIFSRDKNIKLHSIIDTNPTNLLNISKVYDIERIGNKANKVFLDDDINLVVIATPHKFHLEQSLEALKNGKAVFVEKPAVVNFEQYEKLEKFFKFNKNCFYCVDFNRSFASFNMQIKKELSVRKNPLIINYRMNVGYLPKDHWIQDDQNRGRIIGEACHIFELFCFLTDETPISVAVQSLNSCESDFLSTDNFIATIMMSGGSCCNLIYSSIGNRNMEKERMEVLYEGKSILMSDYRELKGFGLPVAFNRKSKYPDKGHELLISEFIKKSKIKDAKSPVPLSRILDATKVTLIVDKLARNNGGFEIIDK
ncbi:zinc-binding dehydrogenase [Candidatus Dependentiae bacterium]|nr:zinc-binding dehydrogenase [Candidatus Dependentiae bacterium]